MGRKVFSNPEMEVNEEYAVMCRMVQGKFRYLEACLGKESVVLYELEELVSSMSILENEMRKARLIETSLFLDGQRLYGVKHGDSIH